MATFKYYLLPAKQCVEAIKARKLEERKANTAKRDLLNKYMADGIMHSGADPFALVWGNKPLSLSGFTVPELDVYERYWIQKPKKNTLRGKEAWREMKEVCELLERMEYSLERALGVYGHVFGFHSGARCFLESAAWPLNDGRVVLKLPVQDMRDAINCYSEENPVAPSFSIEIDEYEALEILEQPLFKGWSDISWRCRT